LFATKLKKGFLLIKCNGSLRRLYDFALSYYCV